MARFTDSRTRYIYGVPPAGKTRALSAALAACASLVLLVQIGVGSAAAVLPAPGEAESSDPAYVPPTAGRFDSVQTGP